MWSTIWNLLYKHSIAWRRDLRSFVCCNSIVFRCIYDNIIFPVYRTWQHIRNTLRLWQSLFSDKVHSSGEDAGVWGSDMLHLFHLQYPRPHIWSSCGKLSSFFIFSNFKDSVSDGQTLGGGICVASCRQSFLLWQITNTQVSPAKCQCDNVALY